MGLLECYPELVPRCVAARQGQGPSLAVRRTPPRTRHSRGAEACAATLGQFKFSESESDCTCVVLEIVGTSKSWVSLLGRHQRAPPSRWWLQPVKRLAEAPFATIITSPVLRTWGPDNSAVRRTIHIQIDANHALLYAATMARDGGSNGTKRTKAPQSAVARWASSGDSPCAAQTPPPPTTPERPP